MLHNPTIADRGNLSDAVRREVSCRCPHCGNGNLFTRYLKPTSTCSHCGERFDDIRTDDIAPYFTILIVGHLIAPFILLLERLYAPPLWVHWLAWPVLTVLLTLLVLPRIKGGVLGWMWWLGLRGDEQH